MRPLLCALVLSLLAGCREELFHERTEPEAVEMVRLLREQHVDAHKRAQQGEGGRYLVEVPASQFAQAASVLHQNGLPREVAPDSGASGVASILPNQSLDDVIALRAHAAEVERALLSLEGVVDARVLLSMKESSELMDAKAPQASLILRCRSVGEGHSGCAISEADAKRVLMTTLPGLTAASTFVILQSVATVAPDSPAEGLEPVLGIPVLASSAGMLRAVLISLSSLVLGLLALNALLLARRNAGRVLASK